MEEAEVEEPEGEGAGPEAIILKEGFTFISICNYIELYYND